MYMYIFFFFLPCVSFQTRFATSSVATIEIDEFKGGHRRGVGPRGIKINASDGIAMLAGGKIVSVGTWKFLRKERDTVGDSSEREHVKWLFLRRY